jgi:alpha-tubulin suppressor-like RCC1 family protein
VSRVAFTLQQNAVLMKTVRNANRLILIFFCFFMAACTNEGFSPVDGTTSTSEIPATPTPITTPTPDPSTPSVLLPATPPATLLSGTAFHTCVVISGVLKCWGNNGYGQLGMGNHTGYSTPVTVPLTSDVVSVSTSYANSCYVSTSQGAHCWGAGASGTNGDTTKIDRDDPTLVTSVLATSVTATAMTQSNACAVVAGGIQCWGQNNASGQLGNNSILESLVGVQAVGLTSGAVQITAGAYHYCALVNGGVQCWGQNGNGQLGNNSTTGSKVPVQVVGLTSGVASIVAGSFHTCALMMTGSLVCWGKNLLGQLGDGTVTERWVPTQVVGLSSGVTAIAAGIVHTCAIVNGAILCWGGNSDGQLGDNSIDDRITPTQVIGLTSGGDQIAAGWSHTCALISGAVKCWGDNGYYQLGNGTSTDSLVPTSPTGL